MRTRHRHQVRQPENPEVLLGGCAHEPPTVAEHDTFDEVAPFTRDVVHLPEHARAPGNQLPHDTPAPGARLGPPRRTRRTRTSPGHAARPQLISRKRPHDRGEPHRPAEFRHILSGGPPHPHARTVKRPARHAHAHDRPERSLARIGLDDARPLASAAVVRER